MQDQGTSSRQQGTSSRQQGTSSRGGARRTAAALATVALGASLALAPAVAAGPPQGKGNGNPSAGSNGAPQSQGKSQSRGRSGASNGAGRSRGASPSRGAAARGRAQGNGNRAHGNPSSRGNSQGARKGKSRGAKSNEGSDNAKAGKTTICHATHSDTNPYVEITVSNNAIKVHDRHQDDEDIVPAPEGGCPSSSGNSVAMFVEALRSLLGGGQEKEHGKTTICHATGSDTNPYVEITISDSAVAAHDRHQHDEDIIPAPAAGCPSSSGGLLPTVAQAVANVLGVSASGDSRVTAQGAPSGTAPATETGNVQAAGEPDQQVAGVSEGGTEDEPQSGVAGVAASDNASDEDEEGEGGSLPFTGLALGGLVLIGLLALVAGRTMRSAAGE